MTTPAPVLFRLLVSCPDRPGIVASVSRFLYDAGANIVSSAQYSTDPEGGAFFLRMEFALPASPTTLDELTAGFGDKVGDRFDMDWQIWDTGRHKRVGILVSRYDHCLLDLLWRWRRGDLTADVEFVVSNHPDLRAGVESFGLPYHHIPVPRDDKAAAEQQILDLLTGRVDLVVLARYMQILSPDFLRRVGVPLINIHHSFLPAFPGASPYERAKQRGVKLVGATAHYVTEELDAGPIIEQGVARVTHDDDTAAISRHGADIERTVLARAVTWHCQDRVLVNDNTTVVFA